MSKDLDLIDLFGSSGSDLTEELREANYHYICGPITQESLLYIQQDLLLRYHNKSPDIVTIVINSYGGDLAATFALVNLMQIMPYKITTVSLGVCGSAATYIAAAGSPGLRFTTKDTLFLFHRFSTGADGNHPQLLAAKRGWDKEHERELKFWTKNSIFKTKKEVEDNLLQEQDVWLTAKQALNYGVVDGVLKSR